MSVLSATYFWVTCDAPDCDADSRLDNQTIYETVDSLNEQFTSEFPYEADTLNESYGWIHFDGKHYCGHHTDWDEAGYLRIPAPDRPPIRNGATA